MIKFLLGIVVLLSVMTATTLGSNAENSSRKSDLSLGLSQECQAMDYRMHNKFAIVYLECDFDDGWFVGKLRQTLFLSSKGFVMKGGRGYGRP